MSNFSLQIKEFKNFSERNSEGKKCLVMKQFLSADQLDEIEEIIEMKITHRFSTA